MFSPTSENTPPRPRTQPPGIPSRDSSTRDITRRTAKNRATNGGRGPVTQCGPSVSLQSAYVNRRFACGEAKKTVERLPTIDTLSQKSSRTLRRALTAKILSILVTYCLKVTCRQNCQRGVCQVSALAVLFAGSLAICDTQCRKFTRPGKIDHASRPDLTKKFLKEFFC